MGEKDLEEQRRLRRAAVTRYGAADVPEPENAQPEADEDEATRRRIDQQSLWVDMQIRQAMERGDFDDLPGAGKPLRLPDRHDPDWWVKQLIEREKIQVAPPAIALRREDAELDATLDKEAREEGVRRVVDDFNQRVIEARRQLQGGPPVVTKTRDPDAEVEAWRARRTARVAEARRRARERERSAEPRRSRRSWFRRRPDAG
jgi:hypothetical protein